MPADPRNPTREELLAEVLRLKRRIQVLETEPVLAGRTVIEGGRDAAAGESLLSLLRRTPDGHCTLDPGGRMLDVSESACALAGCSRE